MSSEFVEHIPCGTCGSSDANGRYTDGHQYCFSCQAYVPGDADGRSSEFSGRKPMSKTKDLIPIERYQALSARKLLKETCEKYGYHIGVDNNGDIVQVAPYRNSKSSQIVAQKLRYPNKRFMTTGEFKHVELFGQHTVRSAGKRVVVTEGELDALSAHQMLGSWPVVSLSNGSSGAERNFLDNIQFLEGFDEVVICFDMDEPGREAADAAARVLSPGKAKIMSLPVKDASDMLVEGRIKEFNNAFWDARSYTPAGIVNGADAWELVSTEAQVGIPYPWNALTDMTYGQRQGELYTWTSGTGMGKSEFVAELAFDLLYNRGETVGYVALEENCGRTGKRMMAKYLSKPIHLPGNEVSNTEMTEAFKATTGSGRFLMYDHWGSQESDKLLSNIRHMIKAFGCRTIILDHLSIVVSGLDDGDERKAIDVTMTKLRALVEETGVKMHLVSHLRRPQGDKGHENGAEVSLSQLRGSHSIVQLSDFVIGIERDQQAEENSDVSVIRVLKNRYSGNTGKAAAVRYSHETGRLTEVPLGELDGEGPSGVDAFGEEVDDF